MYGLDHITIRAIGQGYAYALNNQIRLLANHILLLLMRKKTNCFCLETQDRGAEAYCQEAAKHTDPGPIISGASQVDSWPTSFTSNNTDMSSDPKDIARVFEQTIL